MCIDWALIRIMFDWLANFSVIMITIYGFYKAFVDKKISVIAINTIHGRGGSYKRITLKNHALRDFFIEEAYMIYANEYALHLTKWDSEPLVLKGNGVCKFETEPYSYLKINDKSKLWEADAHIYLRTSEGEIIHARFKKNHKINKKAKVACVPIVREYYNNMLIETKCKYVLRYKKKGEQEQMIQIFSTGVMSDALPEYNEATKEYRWFNGVADIVNDLQALMQLFKNVFSQHEMDFVSLIEVGSTFDDPKNDLQDLTKVSCKELRSSSPSFSNSGVCRKTTY